METVGETGGEDYLSAGVSRPGNLDLAIRNGVQIKKRPNSQLKIPIVLQHTWPGGPTGTVAGNVCVNKPLQNDDYQPISV